MLPRAKKRLSESPRKACHLSEDLATKRYMRQKSLLLCPANAKLKP
jgi:hypothetical protein